MWIFYELYFKYFSKYFINQDGTISLKTLEWVGISKSCPDLKYYKEK